MLYIHLHLNTFSCKMPRQGGYGIIESAPSPVRKRKREDGEDQAGSSKVDRRSPDQPENINFIAEIPEPSVNKAYPGELITREMLVEQKALEDEAVKQEKDFIFQARANIKKRSAEEEQIAKQERINVLKHLLDKSTFFTEYIKKIMEGNKDRLKSTQETGMKQKGRKMD
ncbi:hypothetical protein B566_EDAN001730, partial [Ephemera danica]